MNNVNYAIIVFYQALPTKPMLRIAKVIGDQRLDNDIEIQNETAIKFFLHWPPNLVVPRTCSSPSSGCHEAYTFDKMGVLEGSSVDNTNSGDSDTAYGSVGTYTFNSPETRTDTYHKIEITIPEFDAAGSYGFSIQFVNGISSIKFGEMDVNNADNMKPATESIQLLDPGPVGTGEWVQIVVPKWDFIWVCIVLIF